MFPTAFHASRNGERPWKAWDKMYSLWTGSLTGHARARSMNANIIPEYLVRGSMETERAAPLCNVTSGHSHGVQIDWNTLGPSAAS
jgi:hypothetical protein